MFIFLSFQPSEIASSEVGIQMIKIILI